MSVLATPTDSAPEISALRDQLIALGLTHAAEALSDEMATVVRDGSSPPAFLDQLLRCEINQREEKRIRTNLRLSGLPAGHTLADFDFGFQPAVERSRIETLATGQWIRDRQNLLLLGPPGVGKTHLAIALGTAAIQHGQSVSYYLIEELMHQLRQDAHTPPQHLRRKKYMSVSLLIVDEMGFEPLTREEANLFFRLISYRYERGSLCITSNKPVNEWPDILAGDETLATAILDRLLHAAHVVSISGRSYRLKDLENMLKKPKAP